MKKIVSAQSIKLALLGAALAASGAAFAVDSKAPERINDRGYHGFHHQGHQGHQGHHGHHGHHGHFKAHGFHHGDESMHGRYAERVGLIVPGYGVVSRDFVDGMGLNEAQLKLIEEARESARELRQARKDRIKSARETRAEQFKADTFNPEQALKQAQERRAQWQEERDQIDQKWLAVWNSLDSQQQARVATHLKDKAEKAQQRAEQREERRQQRAEQREERKQERQSQRGARAQQAS